MGFWADQMNLGVQPHKPHDEEGILLMFTRIFLFVKQPEITIPVLIAHTIVNWAYPNEAWAGCVWPIR